MRTNEEFRQLVDDKYKKMNQKRRSFRRRLMTVGSSLLVCVMVFSIFIGSGLYKKIFPYYSSDYAYDQSSEQYENEDTYNSSQEQSAFESSADNGNESGSEKENTFSSDESELSYSDVSEQDRSESDDYYDAETEETSESDDELIFTPDGYDNIKSTVDLMNGIFGSLGIYSENVEVSEEPYLPETPLEPDDEDLESEGSQIIIDAFKDRSTAQGLTDFSLSLFRESYTPGKNNVISPASAIYALAMTSNGARGCTKSELVNVLCGTTAERLNTYMCIYKSLYVKTQYTSASLDGGIWFDSDLSVNREFLKTNYNYYSIHAYKTVMQDEMALQSINGWISERTKGLIPEMLDELDPDTDIVIASTLYFESNWYKKFSLLENKQSFTAYDGRTEQVEMMKGSADGYLENDYCTGFIKSYGKGNKSDFSFIALLPKSDTTVEELLLSLDSNEYAKLLDGREFTDTEVTMPLFESTAELELSEALKNMGISTAFDSNEADFSRMANSDLYLSNVYQNITISVHEKGTLAASATVITAPESSAPSEPMQLIFDRPFVYLIIDNTTNLPAFIGTVEDF